MAVEARRQGIRDTRLVEAVRQGDPRAFEMLYERHQPAILSFCRHLTGRMEDAEDAVQHTFLSAYRELTGAAGQLELKPWLFTVARNRCLSLLRARRVREGPTGGGLWTGRHAPPEERAVETWGAEGLAEEVERREELRALVADLGQLPEPQRAALVLSELEALSHAQIAQVLEVEPAKVRSLVFQARSSLISTRDAREMPCGEIRVQLSTLRGSSLRRRTLRRHVRACAGCREFEAAVRVQRRDLAIILPVVAGAGLRDAAVPMALAGGAAGGAAATGGVAAGGAALAGSAATAGGAGGLLGGLAGAVAGSGVAQFTMVVAVAAAGSVAVAKTDIAQRLGVVGGGALTERLPDAPSAGGPFTGAPSAGVPWADESASSLSPSVPRGAESPSGREPAEDSPGGRGRANAPGQSKKNSGHNAVPPGLAGNGGSGMPPGQARKGEGGSPPGHAKKPGGPPNGRQPGRPESPGQGKDRAKSAPPGQAKGPAKPPPGQAKDPAKSAPPGQAKDPAKPPPGQAKDPAKPAPPGQSKEPAGGPTKEPAKPVAPGQAKEPAGGPAREPKPG